MGSLTRTRLRVAAIGGGLLLAATASTVPSLAATEDAGVGQVGGVQPRGTAKMLLLNSDPKTGTFQVDKDEVRAGSALLSLSGRYVSLMSSHSLDPKEKTTSHWRVWSGDLTANPGKRFDPADGGSTLNGDSGPVLDLSDDGRYTLYYSSAGSIIKGYKNVPLIYDRVTRKVVPAVPNDVIDDGWNLFDYYNTRLSGDGTKVVFQFQLDDGGGVGLGVVERTTGELISTVTVPNNNDAPSIGGLDVDRTGAIVVAQLARIDSDDAYRGQLVTWDVSSNSVVFVPNPIANVYRSVYVSADGQFAAYANFEAGGSSGDDTLYVQNLESGERVSLRGGGKDVGIQGISGNGQWVIGYLDNGPILWDWRGGKTVAVPKPSTAPPGYKLSDHYVSGVDSDAGKVIVGASYNEIGGYGYHTASFLWKR